jgi:hypothetical protein
MKTRGGFVSNSSSCSFVIRGTKLNATQRAVVEHYEDVFKSHEDADCLNTWRMTYDNGDYHFSTFIDNIKLQELFPEIGIPVEDVAE